jgi:hypothetical protein
MLIAQKLKERLFEEKILEWPIDTNLETGTIRSSICFNEKDSEKGINFLISNLRHKIGHSDFFYCSIFINELALGDDILLEATLLYVKTQNQ